MENISEESVENAEATGAEALVLDGAMQNISEESIENGEATGAEASLLDGVMQNISQESIENSEAAGAEASLLDGASTSGSGIRGTIIPATEREFGAYAGTIRKERRRREGYIPPDEVPPYRAGPSRSPLYRRSTPVEDVIVEERSAPETSKFNVVYSDEDLEPIESFFNRYEENEHLVTGDVPHEKYCGPKSQRFWEREYSNTDIRRRNADLQLYAEQRIEPELPANRMRKDILDTIKNNKISIISGETGCGKTTQIPQLILNEISSQGQGCSCKIIITQPRRICATSLARTIAQERREDIGKTVGYIIGGENKAPRSPGGTITLVTNGVALKILQSRGFSEKCSHLIIDEAHERTHELDVLLKLASRLYSTSSTKIVVMSATLCTSIFKNYFVDAAVLNIPGSTHLLHKYFIGDTILKSLKYEEDGNIIPKFETTVSNSTEAILWVIHKRGKGDILAFLPGMREIIEVEKRLTEELKDPRLYKIFSLHSTIPEERKEKIFQEVDPLTRKIILSSNVAQSSITINNIKFVIDTGLQREKRYNAETNTDTFGTTWVSKADAIQRAGRAGRTKRGECFYLFTHKKYEELNNFPDPEIKKINKEKLILDAKIYSPKEDCKSFLEDLIDPPDETAVNNAIINLTKAGLIGTSSLTPLGLRVAYMPLPTKIATSLIYGYALRCLSPLVAAAAVTERQSIFQFGLSAAAQAEVKTKFNEESDQIAVYKILNLMETEAGQWRHNISENFLDDKKVKATLDQKRKIFKDLVGSQMFLANEFANENIDEELVKGILLKSFNNLLLITAEDSITEMGKSVRISEESVAAQDSRACNKLATYFEEVELLDHKVTQVNGVSIVDPVAVILFKEPQEEILNSGTITFKYGKSIEIICTERVGTVLKKLRRAINEISNYFIKYVVPENHTDDATSDFNKVSELREELVQVLRIILKK